MTTQLFWQGDWRPTLRTQEGPATDDEGRFRPIEGWRRNILGEAARLDDPAAGRTIEILTSQPEIRIVRHDGQLALLCGDSRPAPLDDETLYCQKDVYRFWKRTTPPPNTASPQDAVFSFRSDSKVGKRIREDRNTIDYQCIDSG